MANLSSIARPYALAAFEYAKEHKQLPAWKVFLNTASMIARDPEAAKLINNPETSSAMLFDLFHDVLKSTLDTERSNFLTLLTQHSRWAALPEIADLFNGYCDALDKISQVRVVTAIEITDEFRQKLTQALSKRIQQEVTMKCEIDPAILGGAIIHIHDNVIDGSIRGKLSRLRQTLTS